MGGAFFVHILQVVYTDCFPERSGLAMNGFLSEYYPSDAPKDCLKLGKVLGRADGFQSKKAKVKIKKIHVLLDSLFDIIATDLKPWQLKLVKGLALAELFKAVTTLTKIKET